MRKAKRVLYADDLLRITSKFQDDLEEIDGKIGDDNLINQGLFLMITAYFEDSVRELLKTILYIYPEKLTRETYSISREQICEVANDGHNVIIDNALYILFKDGTRTQLEVLFKTLFNKEFKSEKKSSTKNRISEEIKESMIKLDEISLFRNALIHNGRNVTVEMNERVVFFNIKHSKKINFNKELVKQFINEYRKFFEYLKVEIKGTYRTYKELTFIEKTEAIWNKCFSSPILMFKDYWEFDYQRDLITGIKYPRCEGSISGSERVLLSIWRHQFNDSIKTEEFLLCSINYHKIYELYKGLDEIKFYHMLQKSDRYFTKNNMS